MPTLPIGGSLLNLCTTVDDPGPWGWPTFAALTSLDSQPWADPPPPGGIAPDKVKVVRAFVAAFLGTKDQIKFYVSKKDNHEEGRTAFQSWLKSVWDRVSTMRISIWTTDSKNKLTEIWSESPHRPCVHRVWMHSLRCTQPLCHKCRKLIQFFLSAPPSSYRIVTQFCRR